MSTATAPLNPSGLTSVHETYCIVTYGCQMNDNDSEIMAGILEAKGLRRVKAESDADVVLVNTCVVREGAEDRAIARLQSMSSFKKVRPHMVLGVAGCMAQNEGQRVLERVPMADLVIGTRDLFKIGSLVDEVIRTGERLVSINDVDKPVFLDAQPVRRKHGLKALTTIMYGCNNFCTFCIVPKTRGRESSRPPEEILAEITALGAQGFKEVQLLGQNVNSYYWKGVDFSDLLAMINQVEGIERIRFVTSHPKDCSQKLLDACASLDKMCTNFHLPVQSGSNRVLRRMKRFYTKDQYLELCHAVRQTVPGATISTDVIIGFPDETDEDFEETYDLLEKARWDNAFMFMYSPREGTKAATWQDSIPLEVKKHRLTRCLGRQEVIMGEINKTHVGSVEQVLFEDFSRKSEHDLIGRTRGDKSVIVPAPAELIGQTRPVRIVDSIPHTLFGQLV